MEESSNFDLHTKFDENNRQQIIIKFLNKKQDSMLSSDAIMTIDFVVNHCKNMSWTELNNIVNSTYAVINSNQNEMINIVTLAKKYKNAV